jgi:hypothetical protein
LHEDTKTFVSMSNANLMVGSTLQGRLTDQAGHFGYLSISDSVLLIGSRMRCGYGVAAAVLRNFHRTCVGESRTVNQYQEYNTFANKSQEKTAQMIVFDCRLQVNEGINPQGGKPVLHVLQFRGELRLEIRQRLCREM